VAATRARRQGSLRAAGCGQKSPEGQVYSRQSLAVKRELPPSTSFEDNADTAGTMTACAARSKSPKRSWIAWALVPALVIGTAGCHDVVRIHSHPPGAQLVVDGTP